jgi:hypothetical protein
VQRDRWPDVSWRGGDENGDEEDDEDGPRGRGRGVAVWRSGRGHTEDATGRHNGGELGTGSERKRMGERKTGDI